MDRRQPAARLPYAPAETDVHLPPRSGALERIAAFVTSLACANAPGDLLSFRTHESSPVNPNGKRRIQRNSAAIATANPVDLLATSADTSLVSLGLLALAGGSCERNPAALLRSRFLPPDLTLARLRLVSKWFSLSIQVRAFNATHLSTPFRSRKVRTSGRCAPMRAEPSNSATAGAWSLPTSKRAHPFGTTLPRPFSISR